MVVEDDGVVVEDDGVVVEGDEVNVEDDEVVAEGDGAVRCLALADLRSHTLLDKAVSDQRHTRPRSGIQKSVSECIWFLRRAV